MHPRLSIVIPAYNEEELLPACLFAIRRQVMHTETEIIVVDNGSTDGTAMVAGSFGVRVITEPQRGSVFAFRCGFGNARGEIIAMTDADTIPDTGWVASILRTFRDPKVIASTGPIRFDGARALTFLRRLLRHELWGANMAVRKSAYQAVGGFHPSINLNADVELGKKLKKLGTLIYCENQAVSTSGRRFQARPFREGFRYAANSLWLFMFHKPLFWHFPAIRYSDRQLYRFKRRRQFGLASVGLIIVTLYTFLSPTSTVFGQVVVRGGNDTKLVALTFDDGPNGKATRTIVDILTKENVPATFFELGDRIAADPVTAAYVADHHLVIENHSWSHSFRLPVDGPGSIKRELKKTSQAIVTATGVAPTLFRPPHGWRSPIMMYEAHKAGLRMIDWSVDSMDYLTNNPAVIISRVLRHVHAGSIVLLHDGVQDGPKAKTLQARTATIAALPTIISALRAQGYRFVTVPEMLEVSRPTDE